MSSPRPPPDDRDGPIRASDTPVVAGSAPDAPHVGESSSVTSASSNVGHPAATTNPAAASPSLPSTADRSTSPPAAPAPTPTAGPAQQGQSGSPSSPNRRRAQRPLSSISFFIPFTGQPAGADGPQVGLTWTLEVFGNDEEGAAPGPNPTPAADGTPNNANPEAGDGSPAPETQNAQNAPSPSANGNPDPAVPPPGPNPQPANQERDGTRSIFFIVGPDGTMRRGDGAADAAAAPPFPFPFPFAFPFRPGPPPPDPAKAAELLNSLPTVGRALLKRVDKVVAAEGRRDDGDASGWQCGICLEGIDLGETVKALPCNHLFHETCLKPWFTNHHHTCPTCRLDLDPLRTLHEPARRAPLRPATTGSGRGTPAGRAAHPYARPAAPAAAEGRRSRPGSNAPTQPGTPQNERADGGHRLEVPLNPLDVAIDFARSLGLPIGAPILVRDGEAPREGEEAGHPDTAAETGPAADLGGGAAPAPGNTPAEQPGQAQPHGGLDQPMPERHTHIGGGGDADERQEAQAHGPVGTASPTQGEGSEATSGAPPAAAQAPVATPAPARGGPLPWAPGLFGLNPLSGGAPFNPATFLLGGNRTRQTAPAAGGAPDATSAADSAPASASATGSSPATASSTPGGGPPGSPPAGAAPSNPANASQATNTMPRNGDNGADANTPGAGAFHIPFDFFIIHPPPGGAPPEEPEAQPENQPPAQPDFIPQSLESWTAQREKGLGWRCDAVECLIAPPVPDAESMDVDDEPEDDADGADKEMLAIYAESQPPFPPREPGTEPHTGHEFVLLACPHRWHRACLETAARSAGHSTEPDASGREWIRCARCRKEGWIVPREPEGAPSAVPTL
ncbi:hypothetical protein CC85DRAFT_289483 [Cutaneotrichosporon oleaginosum]|uniref:RING-type domain-containing protein n=1 Tax=Cutaneotrichosporon oleaginosum TaxID=879819 RepID=A0A0J0XBN4_9TREE|nr:uncharacterized protein CC85DRAFT_289483 [Cutaneotrichosporon oleaginosum]KLT38483.1 hypothetical protein CC85DRAFT_289483 [Cutaneotrichosporon oleaginosum]TXT12163.1 hypothetical protein COLE_02573 [Cutaneotrichosporon oleaginosum]